MIYNRRDRLARELARSIGELAFACQDCDKQPIFPYAYISAETVRLPDAFYVRRPNGELHVLCKPCAARLAAGSLVAS